MEKLTEEEIKELKENFTEDLNHLSDEIEKTLLFINVLAIETINKIIIKINKGEEKHERK